MRELSPEVVVQLSAADPYNEIVEHLDEALDVLKVIALAMGNPNRFEIWEDDPCKGALERATDTVIAARERASEKASEIWGRAQA